MYQLVYVGYVHYIDPNSDKGFRVWVKNNYFETSEEAENIKNYPETYERDGIVYHIDIVCDSKLIKHHVEECPSGYYVCPKCGGNGEYLAPSRYTDEKGLRYCFKCGGQGIIRFTKKR